MAGGVQSLIMPTVSVITPVYRGESYLHGFFDALVAQTVFADLELVLVHNQPSTVERDLVRSFARSYPDKLVHLVVDETNAWRMDLRPGSWALETVAQSMNRAIAQAAGEYIALWNVDDLRVTDSLEREVAVLESDAHIGLTYGDYVMVARPADTTGFHHSFPEFDREKFTRSCYGGFQMWRKSVHDVAGLFDEQLRSGADFDLWIRIAAQSLMKKTQGDLGYYLNAGSGLSTLKGGLRFVEDTVIGLRYGIIDRIDYRLLKQARQYRSGEVHFGGRWRAAAEYFPEYDARAATLKRLWPRELRRQRRDRLRETVVACWRQPRHGAGVLLRRICVLPLRNRNGR
jgi:glycosyltransferase involved in cell wall biosynthesis